MFALDTHVHTCLSPCAEMEMHPSAIVAGAGAMALDGIAVCDHNAAGNAAAVVRCGAKSGLWVIPGLEITSAEEAHVLALLPDAETASRFATKVQAVLPGRNQPAFGEQVLVDEDRVVLGSDEHFLAGATTWTIEEVVAQIHAAGGVAVAAHVDRETYGIIGQLGMIPDGLPLDALEVSGQMSLAKARRELGRPDDALLCASDAHRPEQIGRGMSFFWLMEPSFTELRQALAGQNGRDVLGGGRPMEELSLHILDLAQNAVEAGARSIAINVLEDTSKDTLVIEVKDDGRGMSSDQARQARDPFFTTRTTRRVGLGLPLVAEAAQAAGGNVVIESQEGRGTCVRATFGHRHLDRQPMGDIESTLMVLLASQPDLHVTFCHEVDGRSWSLDTRQFNGAAAPSLAGPNGLTTLRRVIREGEQRVAPPEEAAGQTPRDHGR